MNGPSHHRDRGERALRLSFATLVVCLVSAPGTAQERGEMFEQLKRRETASAAAWMTMPSRTTSAGAGVNVTSYSLNVRVTGVRWALSGHVRVDASVVNSAVSTVDLDLSAPMTVDSVRVGGAAASHTRTGATLSVALPRAFTVGERLTIDVFYHGQPGVTGFGSYTDSIRTNGSRWIFTLSEPYGARDWWPCVDHPTDKADSVEIIVTCPQGLLGVANGEFQDSTQNGDGTTTFRWKHRYPVATYLIALNVGPYVTFTDWYRTGTTDSMAVVNYIQPDLTTRNPGARTAAAKTPRMLEIFSGLFGAYPFRAGGYGHVEFGWSGGMEHQTLTSLGWNAFRESIIAHELAHQWFGDLITCRSWGDLWLNEGFATYGEALYQEFEYGSAAYASRMGGLAASARSAAGSLFVEDTTNVGNLFDPARVYDKGAWVLHMLRHVVGDSAFFLGLQTYTSDPALRFSSASTANIRAAMESASGRDLGFFFSEWVFGKGYPVYSYALASVSQGPQFLVTVRVQQTTGSSNPAFFEMPVDLRFRGGNLDTTVTVWNNSGDQSWEFLLPSAPDSVQFDPGRWILSTVEGVPPGFLPPSGIPETVELAQNYPNPFNGVTWIRVGVPVRSRVRLEIFDMAGRKVADLLDADLEAGWQIVPWSGGVASGIYLSRLTATPAGGTDVSVVARKIVLVK